MKRTACLLAFLAFAAMPAAAQSNEFGVLFGSTRAMKSPVGKGHFDSGFRQIYYGVELDPGTYFRVELGRMSTRTAFHTGTDANGKAVYDSDPNGTIEHASGVVEYRFSEPYGYTGLFGGVGLYRQKGNGREESDYGVQGGVNALFPLNRTYAVVVEGAYHWMNFYSPRPRYVTVGAGLRLAF